jgi:hypothetical protein
MNIQQPANGSNPSANLSCPHCYTQLPPRAVFCSSCGERVEKKKDWKWERRSENSDHDTQDQETNTVRLPPLSQRHFKHWQLSRSIKDNVVTGQPHISSPLPQNVEAPMSSPLETEIPETEPANARTQRETPSPVEPLQSLPTTPPAPLILEIWQFEVSDTEVPDSKPPGSNRLWPIIIIMSALATGLVSFVFTDIPIRPIIVLWFLFVCPGMVLVRFLRLKEPVVEWTVAIALSFAVDASVAGILLYAGRWSPTGILEILMGISLGGAIMQTGFWVSLQHGFSRG